MRGQLSLEMSDLITQVTMWRSFGHTEDVILTKVMEHCHVDEKAANILLAEANEHIEGNIPRRQFVVSYMHHTGENYGKLTNKQMWQVYCQGDGFGNKTAAELKQINEGWDWSHIRDSSIEGWKRMEKKLNKMGFTR